MQRLQPLTAALITLPLASALAASPAPPLSQGLYIWQRHWDARVAQAIDQTAPLTDAYIALAAEATWRDNHWQIQRASLDLHTLALVGPPVGLALRIGAAPKSFRDDPAAVAALTQLARETLAAARAAHLDISELQLDYDCAESRLADYTTLVRALRPAIHPTPLVITALPCWLPHKTFADLARAADGFVLQVHSLERPQSPDAPITLCDPARARAWVATADRLGVPFRVALPTYSYLAAFAPDGAFVGISAEGPARAWPASAQLVPVRADPTAMAGLLQAWTRDRPANLHGILWYRLPVAGDVWNWNLTTLTAVLRGQPPQHHTALRLAFPSPGLAELIQDNTGHVDAARIDAVALTWTNARLLSADALAGFTLIRAGDRLVRIRATPAPLPKILPAGESRTLAWLRFNTPPEIQLHVLHP